MDSKEQNEVVAPTCKICGLPHCHFYSCRLGGSVHEKCHEMWLKKLREKEGKESND
jgi:hypothetical protein